MAETRCQKGTIAVVADEGIPRFFPQRPSQMRLPFAPRVPPKAHATPDDSTTRPAPPSLSSSSSSAVVAAARDDGHAGFFDSFRNSFRAAPSTTPPPPAPAAASPSPPVTVSASGTAATDQHHAALLHDLVQWERELRDQLRRHEAAEVTQLAHAAERVLLPLIPALRDVSPLDLTQREQLGRWSICDDYLQLLLDATELQEVLHRRALCCAEEPQQRKRIADGEVPDWIEARRLHVMRENQESSSAQNAAQVERLAYFKHVQQQLYQVFLLEEGERADRMEVERLQRLHVGGLAEVIAKEYRRVRPWQLRYEAARHPLHPALALEIAAAEGLRRSILSQDQAHAFKSVQAAEVRDYLTRIR